MPREISVQFVGLALLSGWLALPLAAHEVEAATKPGEPWRKYSTRTLAKMGSVAALPPDAGLTRFGGLAQARRPATGFFRTEQVDGRWWLVDPEGGLFLYRGIASVRMNDTPGGRGALTNRFGSPTAWAERTLGLLREHGFNGYGGWSDVTNLRPVQPPLVHARMWNFMGSYGRKRGGTFQKPGHLGYPNDCIFVFDPDFEKFCDEYARTLAATQDDPWLLGHYSDNEMPLPRQALHNYLKLPPTDPGHQAARDFLRKRHGVATPTQITPDDEAAFQALVVERYFQIVSRAIRKHDPNHLYLGARFHGADLRYPEIFRAAGPHVDVVSVNYYRAWTPDAGRLAMWARESGRPVLITEWYAKGADSGMANTGGAGWLVRTQRDRGLFYQNFALALLESKVCVGWDWFRYIDNDPDDRRVDPSNRDSNKGIVNNRYLPYEPLLQSMAELNQRAYAIVRHFDGLPAPVSPRSPGEKGD